jgi:hypothetical protein
MTRTLGIRSMAVAILAGFVLAGPITWNVDALAQSASPAGSQVQGQAAGHSMIEGKIAKVSGANVTLADGTDLMIPSDVKVQRSDLKPGATVKASFEERGGQKVVTAISVEPTK